MVGRLRVLAAGLVLCRVFPGVEQQATDLALVPRHLVALGGGDHVAPSAVPAQERFPPGAGPTLGRPTPRPPDGEA